jgi:acetoin utilization protein AcuB
MRTRVVTVSPGDTIEHATAVMLERGVAGLPVVENHRVVGIIAESDIFRAFNEIMGNGQRGARIVFMIDADADLAEQLHRRLHGKAVSTLVVRRLASGVREVVARVAGPDTSLLRREVEAATPR